MTATPLLAEHPTVDRTGDGPDQLPPSHPPEQPRGDAPEQSRGDTPGPPRGDTPGPPRGDVPGPAHRERADPERADPERMLRLLAELPEDHPSRPVVRERAIEEWLPLAGNLARRFAGRGEPVQDLVQTAVVGLIKAIDRFDASRGGDFLAYAVPTIVGEVKRYFRDQSWTVHVPRRLQELRLAVGEATEALTQRLGRPPTVAELAADLQVSEEDVREGIRVAQAYTAASLDAPARDDTGTSTTALSELLGEEDASLALAETRLTVLPAVAALPERERRILVLRFFGNLTQDQIADRVGVSQMHVSRLLARTLDGLREVLREQPAGGFDHRRPG